MSNTLVHVHTHTYTHARARAHTQTYTRYMVLPALLFYMYRNAQHVLMQRLNEQHQRSTKFSLLLSFSLFLSLSFSFYHTHKYKHATCMLTHTRTCIRTHTHANANIPRLTTLLRLWHICMSNWVITRLSIVFGDPTLI